MRKNSDIRVLVAEAEQMEALVQFLSHPEIDNAFSKPLSQRAISITERVYGKFASGFWLIALNNKDEIIGCRGCNGLSISDGERVVEFSTLALFPKYRGLGIAKKLVSMASDLAEQRYGLPLMLKFDAPETSQAVIAIALAAGFEISGTISDNTKRPDGVRSVIFNCYLQDLLPSKSLLLLEARSR